MEQQACRHAILSMTVGDMDLGLQSSGLGQLQPLQFVLKLFPVFIVEAGIHEGGCRASRRVDQGSPYSPAGLVHKNPEGQEAIFSF